MKLKMVPVLCALALASGQTGLVIFSLPYHDTFVPAAFAQPVQLDAAQDPKPDTKPDTKQDPKKELPRCLAEIAKATVIEDATLRSVKLKDSLLAAQKLGPKAKDLLIEVIQTATPAGRLISLALLRKLDAGEYQKLADQLKQELGDQSVSYISPSERCHYSVSDILNDMAAKTPLIKLLPEAASK
jgi:hypothetical protein